MKIEIDHKKKTVKLWNNAHYEDLCVFFVKHVNDYKKWKMIVEIDGVIGQEVLGSIRDKVLKEHAQ